MGKADEARTLLNARLDELQRLTIAELARYEADENVTGRSGRTYKLRAYSFWDVAEWESDLYTHVKLYGSGWRRVRPYSGGLVSHRGEEAIRFIR